MTASSGGSDACRWCDSLLAPLPGKGPEDAEPDLDEARPEAAEAGARYPFSFLFDGQRSDGVLGAWPTERKARELDDGRRRISTVWTDPGSGVQVQWEAMRFADFPAVEWLLYFGNTGLLDDAANYSNHNWSTQESFALGVKPYFGGSLLVLGQAGFRKQFTSLLTGFAGKDDKSPRIELFMVGNAGGDGQHLLEFLVRWSLFCEHRWLQGAAVGE